MFAVLNATSSSSSTTRMDSVRDGAPLAACGAFAGSAAG
jgi:hypothetical protein